MRTLEHPFLRRDSCLLSVERDVNMRLGAISRPPFSGSCSEWLIKVLSCNLEGDAQSGADGFRATLIAKASKKSSHSSPFLEWTTEIAVEASSHHQASCAAPVVLQHW
jgi:hypothetical protein